MLLNNQTDTSNSYLRNNLNKFNDLEVSLQKLKRSNQIFNNLMLEETNFTNCSYIYNNINDTIFEDTSKDYPDELVRKSLIYYCNNLLIMNTKKIENAYHYVNLQNTNILNDYENANGDYDKFNNIANSDAFMEIYYFITLVLRPIRTYINDVLLRNLVDSTSNTYLFIKIIYLICNIIIDIIVLIIIHRFFIYKIIKVDKDFHNLIICYKENYLN